MATIDLSKYQGENKPKGDDPKARGATLTSGFSNILNAEIKLFEKKFEQKEKEWFYTELGLLLSAGVNIKAAFEIIAQETNNKKHKILIEKIKTDVISGKSIADALKGHPEIFTSYEYQSVKIGEETGHLSEVLSELGKFYTGAVKLKRQIIGTLTYPVIVLSLATVIVYFMLTFVIPMFADMFKQAGKELPATTIFLIKVSNHASLIFYSILIIVSGFYLLHKTQSKRNWYRSMTANFFLKIPIVNALIKKIYLARFCQSMRLLLGAKVLLIDALEMVKNMINYYPIEQALEIVKADVLSGKPLNESLSNHSIFPQKLTALIKVSEEVNAPELIFKKLSDQYSDEIEHQQAVLGKVIEPVFIIILGGIIGFILVSMYMPLFQISNGF